MEWLQMPCKEKIMSEPILNYPAIASRALPIEDLRLLRNICDEHKFSYGVFCAVIVKDVLHSQQLLDTYIRMTQQFEDDRKPATIEEMKTLREQLRQQEEELESLRAFKRAAQNSFESVL